VPVDFRIGDVIRLGKPHPCGSFEWTVVRIGADIGMRCTKCGHRVLLERSEVERRLRSFVSHAAHSEPFGGRRGDSPAADGNG